MNEDDTAIASIETRATPAPNGSAPTRRRRLPVLKQPRTRAECVDGPRPCPWFSCEHHLYADLERHGAIVDPENLTETCALDVARRGPLKLLEIGALLRISRSRVSQIEQRALRKLRDLLGEDAWAG